MKQFPVLLCVLLCSCTQYALVKEGPQTVKAITVTPSQEWNKVPSVFAPGGLPTWTADGISLNSIAFISGIKDGVPLIQADKKEEYPTFRADMLPTELAELIESSIAKLFKATISASGQLRPLQIDGKPGFEYGFEFVTQDHLRRKAYVAGVVKEGQLHLMFYQAARMYYYDRHLSNVANMMKAATIN